MMSPQYLLERFICEMVIYKICIFISLCNVSFSMERFNILINFFVLYDGFVKYYLCINWIYFIELASCERLKNEFFGVEIEKKKTDNNQKNGTWVKMHTTWSVKKKDKIILEYLLERKFYFLWHRLKMFSRKFYCSIADIGENGLNSSRWLHFLCVFSSAENN